MRLSLPVGALILTAAASGWFARGFGVHVDAAPVPHAAPQPVLDSIAVSEPVPVMRPSHIPPESRGDRDLFAYREPEPPPDRPVVARVLPPGPEVQPLPVETPPPSAPPPPRFPWRFIGTVGTEHNRVAAFSRDGEIVTARQGDRVGDDFVLRAIGLESVEVQPIHFEDAGSQKVPLGGSDG